MAMDKNIEQRIEKKSGAYDHIVWHGRCSRCGARRYVFIEEVRKMGDWIDNNRDLTGKVVECKSVRCKGKCKIKGRVESFRATHLNDIRKRGSDIEVFNRV